MFPAWYEALLDTKISTSGPWPGGVSKFAAVEASKQGIILSDNVNKELLEV